MEINAPLIESVRLLLEVHACMRVGCGNSPKANAARNQSEYPWYAMTDEQQKFVGLLSEILYEAYPEKKSGDRGLT